MNDIVYQHEVIVPDRGLPFKLFLFAGKSEAEIEKYIALCKQAEAFQKDE